MRTFVAILVISSMVLSSCGRMRDSRLNPGNWFGKSKSRQVAAATTDPAEVNPLIPQQADSVFRKKNKDVYLGTPIDQITDVTVERLPTGAIVRVTAIAARQDVSDIRLTSDTNGEPVDGVLTFTLKAVQLTDSRQGLPVHRTIHAGRFVSNGDLEATRTIRVVGARNTQTTSR